MRIVLIFNDNDFEDSIRDHITDLVESIISELSSNLNSGVTIGPADPAVQGAPFQGVEKLLEMWDTFRKT